MLFFLKTCFISCIADRIGINNYEQDNLIENEVLEEQKPLL